MAKKKTKNLGRKIVVWVMLIAMVLSLFTTVFYGLFAN